MSSNAHGQLSFAYGLILYSLVVTFQRIFLSYLCFGIKFVTFLCNNSEKEAFRNISLWFTTYSLCIMANLNLFCFVSEHLNLINLLTLYGGMLHFHPFWVNFSWSCFFFLFLAPQFIQVNIWCLRLKDFLKMKLQKKRVKEPEWWVCFACFMTNFCTPCICMYVYVEFGYCCLIC